MTKHRLFPKDSTGYIELLPLCVCINVRLARKITKQCEVFKLIKAENYFVINKHKTDQTAIP